MLKSNDTVVGVLPCRSYKTCAAVKRHLDTLVLEMSVNLVNVDRLATLEVALKLFLVAFSQMLFSLFVLIHFITNFTLKDRFFQD